MRQEDPLRSMCPAWSCFHLQTREGQGQGPADAVSPYFEGGEVSLTLLRAGTDESHLGATYQDLLLENLALRAQVHAATPNTTESQSMNEDDVFVLDDTIESFGVHLFDSLTYKHLPCTVTTYEDVEFPTRKQSDYLILQARERISWIHYALHDEFWNRNEGHSARLAYDPAWLAIYFSTLSVSFCPAVHQHMLSIAGRVSVLS